MILLFFFMSFIFSYVPPIHSATSSPMPICPTIFKCPDLTTFEYPFYNVMDTRCGLIKVNCTSKGGEIQFGGQWYEILSKIDFDRNSGQLFISKRKLEGLVKNKSCEALMNNFTSPSPSPLLYSISMLNFINLFKCPKNLTNFKQDIYNSFKGCQDYNFYYNYFNTTVPSDLPHTCQVVQLPVNTPSSPGFNETNIFSLLYPAATIIFNLSNSCSKCQEQNRFCEISKGVVQCFDVKKENPGRKRKIRIPVLVIVGGPIAILIVCLFIFIIWRQCKNNPFSYVSTKNRCQNLETFLKNHEFLAPKRYSYAQVEKITNSFKVKLGKGGFGTVYKGVLKNQNPVAVKVLSEVKGDGQDFINEVASVGRTSHVNIVSLLGFCLEGRQRALIYEFMPNGSLEKFIYSHGSSSSSQLGWEKLHQISVGIARGLEYLHRGCSTRILHFDIKPHNILLDNDFCPKISDFGMAKLFREKESKISVSHMRGTPGYIAPELFYRSFGDVSHKSDVYSYGMMILEMVGGRKNIEVGVDHTSEIYFPHWIYQKIELHEERLGLNEIVNDEDNKIARKMIIVGLWCIQMNPLSRPTMTKVLEMLEGELASLEIPPKPYLSSPSRLAGSQSIDTL